MAGNKHTNSNRRKSKGDSNFSGDRREIAQHGARTEGDDRFQTENLSQNISRSKSNEQVRLLRSRRKNNPGFNKSTYIRDLAFRETGSVNSDGQDRSPKIKSKGNSRPAGNKTLMDIGNVFLGSRRANLISYKVVNKPEKSKNSKKLSDQTWESKLLKSLAKLNTLCTQMEVEIREAYINNPLIKLNLPTGSGKTIITPIIVHDLHKAKKTLDTRPVKSIIAGPTVLNAIEPAEFIARTQKSLGDEPTVAFAHATDNSITENSEILFTSYAWLLNKGLESFKDFRLELHIDEYHKGDVACLLLLREALNLLSCGKLESLTLSSATPNNKLVDNYLSTKLPYTLIPKTLRFSEERKIVPRAPAENKLEGTIRALKNGESVLVLCAGEYEVLSLSDKLRNMDLDVHNAVLYRLASRSEKLFALKQSDRPKVVFATVGIAKTGLTIPGITTVIYDDRKKSLLTDSEIGPCLAYTMLGIDELTQIEGRGSRDLIAKRRAQELFGHSGIVTEYYGEKPFSELKDFAEPEIYSQTQELAKHLLRATCVTNKNDIQKISIDKVVHGLHTNPLMYNPKDEQLDEAIDLLKNLELISNSNFPTVVGELATQLLVDLRPARFLVEAKNMARDYNLPQLLNAAVDIASIIAAKGVVKRSNSAWKSWINNESESDAIAQMHVFQYALEFTDGDKKHFASNQIFKRAIDFKNSGFEFTEMIDQRAFQEAKSIRKELMRRLQMPETASVIVSLSNFDKQRLQACFMTAYIDQLFVLQNSTDQQLSATSGMYRIASGANRPRYKHILHQGIFELQMDSPLIIKSSKQEIYAPRKLIGEPFSCEIQAADGEIELLQNIYFPCKLDATWVAKHIESHPFMKNNPRHYESSKRKKRSNPGRYPTGDRRNIGH